MESRSVRVLLVGLCASAAISGGLFVAVHDAGSTTTPETLVVEATTTTTPIGAIGTAAYCERPFVGGPITCSER